MEAKNRKFFAASLAVIVLAVATAVIIKYKIFFQDSEVSQEPALLEPLPPVSVEQNHQLKVTFLAKASNFRMVQILSQSKQALLISGGELVLADISSGRIIKTITAQDFPSLNFYSAAMVDGDFFISSDQEILRINSQGKLLNTYNVANGLVNAFNLYLTADPFEPHTLWIATFDGLSKLDTQNNQFTNYKNELLPNSKSYGISLVRPTSENVWVYVDANSYSSGGIAKLNRKTNTWESYGPSSFGLDRPLYIDGFLANDSTVVVFIRGSKGIQVMVFDPESKSWHSKITLEVSDNLSYNSPLGLEGSRVYLFKYTVAPPAPSKLNLVSIDLAAANPVVEGPVAGYKTENYNESIANSADSGLWFYNQTSIQHFSGGQVSETFNSPDIPSLESFVGASGQGVYFSRPEGGFGRYDVQSGQTRIWNDPGEKDFLYSDRVVVENDNSAYLAEEQVNGYGGGVMRARFVRLNLQNSNELKEFEVPAKYLKDAHQIGIAADGEMYLHLTSANKTQTTYVFDWLTNSLKPSQENWTVKEKAIKFFDFAYGSQSNVKQLGDYKLIASVDNAQAASLRSIVSFTITRPNGSVFKSTATLAPQKSGAFGWSSNVYVNFISADEYDKSIAWIGTSFGLVKLNLETGQTTASWASQPGLNFWNINHVQALKDYLVVSADSGILIVKKDELK